MHHAQGPASSTAVAASSFARLDHQVELTLHNFTALQPPALQPAVSASPGDGVAAIPISAARQVIDVGADVAVAAAAVAAVPASSVARAQPANKEPESGDDGDAWDCYTPNAGVPLDSRQQVQAVGSRDRKADENAVKAMRAQRDAQALEDLLAAVRSSVPAHCALPADLCCDALLSIPLPTLRERLKQLGLSPSSRSRISSLVIIEAARRSRAASDVEADIQKRARSFYRERLGSLLAEAKHSLTGTSGAT